MCLNLWLCTLLLLVGCSNLNRATGIYTLPTCSFTFLGYYIPDSFGTIYYIAAAINSLMIITLLAKYAPRSLLSLTLQSISIKFILLNAFGWVMYMLYQPAIYYNMLATILYLYTITELMPTDANRVTRATTLDSRKSSFLLYSTKSLSKL